MGCPDAVRAELLKLTGMLAVNYNAQEDVFSVRYESVMLSLDVIFAAVFAAGKQLGREYLPEILS